MNKKAPSLAVLDTLIQACARISSVLLPIAALCIVYEVLMRYVFRAPTIWVTEVSIYLVLAATFLCQGYAMREKAHVNVDFVTLWLSGRSAVILNLFTCALGVLYCAVFAWEGFDLAYGAYRTSELAGMLLKVPKFIPEAFIPIGAALLLVQLLKLGKSLFAELIASAPKPDGIKSIALHSLATVCVVILLLASFVFLKTSTNLGLFILFFCLLFSGMPVAFALGLFGVFCFFYLYGGAPMMIRLPIMAYSTMDSPVMVALPLYILTSNILWRGDVGGRIFRFANVLVRHLPGGLGVASIIFCGLFAAMTGSSAAVAATVSVIALPEMLAKGYKKETCVGLLAAGGTLGILFPPSLALMLYASMTNESIGDLFAATLIPGLLLSAMFCLYMMLSARGNSQIQREQRASLREIVDATKSASGGLITILIIIGGIYSGIFTPTESGGIAAIYSMILCFFVYRTLTWKKLQEALLDTSKLTAMIMLIIIGANITGQVVLLSQIPQNILGFVASSGFPAWAVIVSINILLIIMGGPLEAITILVIALPVLYPLVTGLGFSGVWFAVIMVINMELALISPPEGLNLFILQNLSNATTGEVTRGVIPFLVILAIFLILISTLPELTLWLPALLKT